TAYLVEKGSVAVNGVSLTVAGMISGGFTLAIIPHTLATTTLKLLQPGAVVNLEADIIGKYVAQQVARNAHSPQQADANLLRLLQDEGFAS
ncbi:MAG TPA: riboflavin synthase, partial [Armatimonadota bacterium]|nr:riboflavin synthase [Armatimonadota bacterium]